MELAMEIIPSKAVAALKGLGLSLATGWSLRAQDKRTTLLLIWENKIPDNEKIKSFKPKRPRGTRQSRLRENNVHIASTAAPERPLTEAATPGPLPPPPMPPMDNLEGGTPYQEKPVVAVSTNCLQKKKKQAKKKKKANGKSSFSTKLDKADADEKENTPSVKKAPTTSQLTEADINNMGLREAWDSNNKAERLLKSIQYVTPRTFGQEEVTPGQYNYGITILTQSYQTIYRQCPIYQVVAAASLLAKRHYIRFPEPVFRNENTLMNEDADKQPKSISPTKYLQTSG